MSRIAVVGGGITGLTACHYIRQYIPSARVSLFEKQSRYGGWIKTLQIPISSNSNCIPIESGPNTLRGGKNDKTLILAQLIKDLNLSDAVIGASKEAKNRYIFHDNQLYELKRIAFKCFLSAMVWMPYQQLYYFLKGGHSHRYNDESIFDFFNRNCGKNVTNTLAASLVNGVYGGGLHHLSIKSCPPFNVLKEIEMEHGSYFVGGIKQMTQRKAKQLESMNDNDIDMMNMSAFTFKQGLQQLVDALVTALTMDANVTLYNKFTIDAMRYSQEKQCIQICNGTIQYEFDHVFNAVQPAAASSFLDSNYNLNEFNLSASLVTVNMIFKKECFVKEIKDKLKGFGVLIPNDNDSLLGIIYYSSAFEKDDSAFSLILMFGGSQFDVNAMSANEITTLCKIKLKQIYGVNADEKNKTEIVCDASSADGAHEAFSLENPNYVNADIVYNINRLNDAINHYRVGHMDKLQSLRDHLANVYGNKVSVIGSGYDGVGIHDCITSAHQSVQQVTKTITDLKTPY